MYEYEIHSKLLRQSRSKTRDLQAFCDNVEPETEETQSYKASFSWVANCRKSTNARGEVVFKVTQPENNFDLNEIKFKDLVLLSTKELYLGGKKDIKEFITQMKDFLELISRETVALTCVS